MDGIDWIRLHYAFPHGFPEDILEVIASKPNICNYLDMPLQHISDNMLKAMRRGTNRQRTYDLIQRIREEVPGIALRTTMIAGYPGETEQDFEDLKEFIQDVRFERLGVFTYSHEENTHAFKSEDDVPEEVKMDRANQIMEIQGKISWELNQQKIGQVFRVLIDRKEGEYYVGRTEFDSPDVDNEVLIPASAGYIRTGDFYQVHIDEATDFDLYGQVVNQPVAK